MNLMRKPPTGQKRVKPKPDRAHVGCVKQLPCVICNAAPPSDAHHCQHRPPVAEEHIYVWLPTSINEKSHCRDTIPLCKACHQVGPNAIHNGKQSWGERNGPDYSYLPQVRAAVEDMLLGDRF